MSRHSGSTATGRRRVVLSPDRVDLTDAGFLFVLMTLAVLGLRSTFSGSLYLVVGLVGTVLGLLIAHLANALRQPMISVAAMALAAFFLLGGAVALRGTSIAGVLPSGSTFHGLADESIHGWKDLLTTLPPVDGNGPLLVLPYVLGLLGGVGGLTMARRLRASFAPLIAPAAVLATVILLGTHSPAALTLQGAVFAVVALAWAAVRANRRRDPLQNGSGRTTRFATAVALLAVAGAGAALLGPHVPGNSGHKRVVLRSYVHPPFDIGQYPSPLAGFRKYTKPAKDLFDKQLFSVSGLPSGSLIRIATLDAYDGLTWRASNQPNPGDSTVPDTFQRVGSSIDASVTGPRVTYQVVIDPSYHDVWLPDAGYLTGIKFDGADAKSHGSNFRYDLATGTGVVPDRLAGGDTYSVHAVLAPPRDLTAADAVAIVTSPATGAGDFLRTQAQDWSAKTASPTDAILAVAKHLYDTGKFTDGAPPNDQYLPGHYQGRLLTFVNGAQIAGNDEQYAATFALMINELGTPARVVLGAALPDDGIVKGQNVHAWVEVQVSDGSWRTIPQTDFMNRNNTPDKQPPQQPQQHSGQIVPPPSHVRPHSSLDEADAANTHSLNQTSQKQAHQAHGIGIPAWVVTTARWGGPPVGLVVVVAGLIIAAKAMRRRRRRTRGSPSIRLSRGWREIVDHARDLGAQLPAGHTRREEAALLAAHDVAALARSADAHVFGAGEPADTDAHEYWRGVDEARRRMSKSVGRWRRLRAAVSVASLRRRPAAAQEAAS